MAANPTVPRLKFFLRTNPSKSEVRSIDPETEVSFVPMEAVGEYGGLDLQRARPLSDVMDGYTYFRDGDVVVAKITPCFENGKGALAADLSAGIGFGTTELHVLRALDGLDSRYLFYLTISHRFRKLGESTMYGAGGQKRVSDDFIMGYRHELPPLPAQRAIADFLDRQTAKIDALIEKKRRLINLLDEKRTALITRAVTCGLDPDAPMKDSGVEWLGKIPAHWEVRPIKRLWSKADYGISDSGRQGGQYPVLTMGDIDGGRVRIPANRGVTDVAPYLLLQPGDLLFNRTNSRDLVGKVGLYDGEGGLVTFASYLVRLRLNETSLPEYAGYLLNAPPVLEQARARSLLSVNQANLNPTRYGEIPVPIPPLVEQKVTVSQLDRLSRRCDSTSHQARRAIALLEEYRTALVSAAVTGKIDLDSTAA